MTPERRIGEARPAAADDRGLIDELTRDLAPVRVAPSLHTAAGIVVGAWLVLGAIAIGPSGLRADLFGAALAKPGFLAALFGLGLASIGGTLACLAAAAPGREQAVRLGVRITVAGLVGATATLLAIGLTLGIHDGSPPSADAMCFRRASVLAGVLAVLVSALCLRGWVTRPLLAGLAAGVGAGSLGALLVHFSCSLEGPRHLLMGHVAVPIGLGALLALPFAALLRRFGR